MRFEPLHPEAIADPYPVYRRLREEEPVHWSERHRSWFLARYDDVAAALVDDRLSADRTAARKFRGRRLPSGVRSLLSDPPEHTLVRGLLDRSMSPAVKHVVGLLPSLVESLMTQMQSAVEDFLERRQLERHHGDVDLVAELAYPLPLTVIADMLAVPAADRERFQAWSEALARGMDHFFANRPGARRFDELNDYFARLVTERRSDPDEDLLSRLIAAELDGERLTDDELVSLCTTLLFAGHETTVNLIGNGMLALLQDREQKERLRETPELEARAIEELLRFDSPAQMIARTAREPIEIAGRSIAVGDAVVVLLGSANRDPERFERPEQLRVDRRPNPHLAFGRGAHFCAGATLTRQEARAAIPALLRRFPDLRLGEAPPVRRQTAVLRGLESLPVRLG